MERMVSGRVWVSCLTALFTLQVCLATGTSNMAMVDVLKDGTAQLPCSHTFTGNIIVVQWLIESSGTRTRIAFRSISPADSGVDKDTPLAGRITMKSDMSLVISQVMVADERVYICEVVGVDGTTYNETKLRVFDAPEMPVVSENKAGIPLNPDDPARSVGKCTSKNGYPEPRIIWFKDSNPLPMVTDAKEKMYMVQSVVKESSGLYTVTSTLHLHPEKKDTKSVFHCTVEYYMPNGEIKKENSEPFNLTLLYPAEKATFKLLNTAPIKEGDDVQMKCETDGNPQPQFEFTRTGHKTQTSESGLLTVRNITRTDAGSYSCVAMDFDALEPLVDTINITVHHLDPVSVVPAGPLMIEKGNPIELQCKTKSSDGYTISWMKDGNTLSHTGSMSLLSAKLNDTGDYVCTAKVPSVPGLQKQANVTVIVSGKPEIDEPITGMVAKEGDMVTLRCSALGHPAPQFTWKPSGKESVIVNGNRITSTITLKATVDVLNDGVTCEVNNVHGADSKKFMVQIKSDNDADSNDAQGSSDFATAEEQQGGSKAVVVAVLVCVLLLLLLVALLYFLSKKGSMACRKNEKKDAVPGEPNNDIVVEMKSGQATEESGLLNKTHVEK